MSYAPGPLLDARAYLQAKTGLPAYALGIVGGPSHGGEGYHVGLDRLLTAYGYRDYSVAESPRDGSPTDAASAFDIGRFDRLRQLSIWIVEQCKAGAPDTLDIREVIYSPDGVTVHRWDRLGVRTGGDSSHLEHTHISYHRDSERRDKTALFRRFFEGAPSMEQTDKLNPVSVNAPPRTVGMLYNDLGNKRDWEIGAAAQLLPGSNDWPRPGSPIHRQLTAADDVKEIKADVAELLARPATQPVELTPEQMAQLQAALAEPIAVRVVEMLRDRLQS